MSEEQKQDKVDSAAPVKEEKKKYKEPKPYKTKLKRHFDSVLSIYSAEGKSGEFLFSGSADHTVRRK